MIIGMKPDGQKTLIGFLNVNKPAGMTSSDVVEKVRGILEVRGGHGGTLDPAAEGVLVIGVGDARKFLSYLDDEKEYEGLMRLGRESSTGDGEGVLSEERPVEAGVAEITAAAAGLIGFLDLPVPAYSAVHVGGRRLYEMARAGRPVEPPVRRMHIKSLEILEIQSPLVRFSMTCAAGVYVRSVVLEWGRLLGCGAYIEKLTRTRSGIFSLTRAAALKTIEEKSRAGEAGELVIPAFDALSHLPAALLSENEAAMIRHGREVDAPADLGTRDGLVRMALAGGGMLGVGQLKPAASGGPGRLLPVRLVSGDLASI